MNRLRNILICLAVFFTQFIPSYANAMSWNDIKATATAAGASVTASGGAGGATRTAAATVPWGSIKNGLSKGLKGGGNFLLGAAIYAALSATDYTLDPANNSVTYKPVTSLNDGQIETGYRDWYVNSTTFRHYPDPSSACSAYVKSLGYSFSKVAKDTATAYLCYYSNTGMGDIGTGFYGGFGVYTTGVTAAQEAANVENKSITIPDLLQLLIDQMNNNDAAIKNVLDQILESSIAQAQAASNTDADLKAMLGALTAALDNAATYAGSGTANGTQTTTATGANLKLDFPVFCGWAGIVCEAAQTAINFPTTVGEWWKTLTDRWTTVGEWWTTIKSWRDSAVAYVDSLFAEPELPDEDNTIPDSTVAPDLPSGNYISFSSTCPFSNQNNSIEINGQTTTIQNDFSDACTIATDMRPVVLLLSALISFGIMAGFNFSGSTQDE